MGKRRRDPPRLLAVEGPPGAGKSAFVERWCQRVSARRVEVPAEDNPFLDEARTDPARRGFPAQMYFLLTRHRRQADLRQGELFQRTTVVDFLLERDRIYADLTLPPDAARLHERIFGRLVVQAVAPDLVVYLHDRPDALEARIRGRGQRPPSPSLLKGLLRGYGALFAGYSAAPVLSVDSRGVDLEEDDRALEAVVDRVFEAGAELRRGDRAHLDLARRA